MADTVKLLSGGLKLITRNLLGPDSYEIIAVQWGEGTTVPTQYNTALETPCSPAEAVVDGTPTQETTYTTDDTYVCTATLTCNSTSKNISEVCLFGKGTLFPIIRATFTPIAVVENDTITFVFKIIFRNS